MMLRRASSGLRLRSPAMSSGGGSEGGGGGGGRPSGGGSARSQAPERTQPQPTYDLDEEPF